MYTLFLVDDFILLEIDCAAEDFIWRPYVRAVNNSLPHVVCKEKDHWVLVDSGLCDEFEGLVRCLRMSELVSLEVDCIEQYLPNRVAMQFGMDQSLPGFVARVNGSSEIAWSNYTRPTGDTILYILARLFESDVTTRYLQWWDKL
ncbi:Aminotransferase-like [Forsythia ovata]|uniref:Aminotransferase-like n=1 Tax=Forsythia ovata TaxID=205694 RepID=A0ABD1SB23_9LAMI